MVPFWVPIIIRHLLFRVPKRDLNFDNYPCKLPNQSLLFRDVTSPCYTLQFPHVTNRVIYTLGRALGHFIFSLIGLTRILFSDIFQSSLTAPPGTSTPEGPFFVGF